MKGQALVVVTRPAPDHAELQRQLSAGGWDSAHCPAFRIEDIPERQMERVFRSLDQCDLVVVTSPPAARRLRGWSGRGSAGGPAFLCPGHGTAAALSEVDIQARFAHTGSTSEDLLAMPELNRVRGRRIAILAAPGGRNLLLESLRGRGATVRRHFLYWRRSCTPAPAVKAALLAHQSLFFMFSSSKAFATLAKTLDAPLRERMLASPLIVSSARLARHCRESGANRVMVAAGASDEAMLEALEQYRKQVSMNAEFR